MGNNTTQPKKKKENTKIHSNFLIKKKEKNEEQARSKIRTYENSNGLIIENFVPDFNFSTMTKPLFIENKNSLKTLPKINSFEEGNDVKDKNQIIESSFQLSHNVLNSANKNILNKNNNRYLKNLYDLEDEFRFNEMAQKTNESFFEKKLFEKSIVKVMNNFPCNSSLKKNHIFLYRKANSQKKKSKFSKNRQEIHSKLSSPSSKRKSNLMEHDITSFSPYHLNSSRSTEKSLISSLDVKVNEEKSFDQHSSSSLICLKDNLKENAIQLIEEKEAEQIYVAETVLLHQRAITSIVISPKNNFVITASEDKTIKIIDTIKNQEIESLPCPNSISCLSISPDEKMFAYAGNDICVKVRIMENFKLHRLFRDIPKQIEKKDEEKQTEQLKKAMIQVTAKKIAKNQSETPKKFNNKKKVMLIDEDEDKNTIKMKFAKNKCTSKNKKEDINQNEGKKTIIVHCLIFSPDSEKIAVGYSDSLIRVWKVDEISNFFYLRGHSESVLSLIFTYNGENLISGGKNGEIIIWDVEYKNLLNIISAHKCDIFSLSISKDDNMLASGGRDKKLMIWNLEKIVKINTYDGKVNPKNLAQVQCVEKSANLTEFKTFEEDKFWINSICFSYDGKLIIYANGDQVKIRNLENGKIIQNFGGSTFINSLTLSTDCSEIYSGHNDGNVRAWTTKQKLIERIGKDNNNDIHEEETFQKEIINEGKDINLNEQITIQKEKVFLNESLDVKKEKTSNKNEMIDNDEIEDQNIIFREEIHNATTLIYTSSHYEKFLEHIVLHPNDQEQYLNNLFNSDRPTLLKLKMLLNILTCLKAQKHDRLIFYSICSKVMLYLRRESFLENGVYEKFLIHFIPLMVSIAKLKNMPDQELNFLFMIMDTTISLQTQSQNLNYNKFLSIQQINSIEKEIFFRLEEKIAFELRKMEEKDSEEFYLPKKYLSQLINCFKPENFQNIINCIKLGKFDKRLFCNHLDHSVIIGEDEGIYILLNTVSEEEMSYLNKDAYMEKEYLRAVSEKILKKKKNNLEVFEKEQEFQKILIGKGTFGKVRISMVLISSQKTDISMQKGEIICVKKSKDPDSTWNDYICIDSLDSAEIYDMKIIKKLNPDDPNEKFPKGYCFQKLLPYRNGDAFLKKNGKICNGDSCLEKWSHKRQYFLNLFRIIINLHNQGFCMTDLKPANTLYNKRTKITKLIDLAGLIRKNTIEQLKKCKVDEIIDNLEYTYKYSAPEICEIEDYEGREIDLTKAIAYTFGKMMKEIILDNPTEKFKFEKEIYDLCEKLTNLIPESRLTLEEGLNFLEKIDPKRKNIQKKYEKYIKAVKQIAFTEPFKLRLKKNILEIIKNMYKNVQLTDNDPEIFPNEPKRNRKAFKYIDNFLKRKNEGNEEILFLLGPAGSGKSTIIQKSYLKFLKNWKKTGDAIPIYMNLCQETNIAKQWNQVNEVLEYKNTIGFNYIQGEEEYPFVLFLDSFDESKEDFRILSNILNNLQRRNSNKKVILSCRSDYFNYYKKNEIKRTSSVVKYILPLGDEFLSTEDFKKYLECYFHGKTSDEIKEYMQKINNLNFREILKNYQTLSIVIDILPTLSKNCNNLCFIYNEYIRAKIISEQKKCAIPELQIKPVDFFIEKAIKLAQCMIKTKKGANLLEGEDSKHFLQMNFGDDYYKSSLPFFEQTEIYSIFKILDLNINVQNKSPNENIKLSFSHEKIRDYLIVVEFFNQIFQNNSYPDWISKKLIGNNDSLINFMTEKIKGDNIIIEKFKNEIKLTKYSNDENTITKASNLISILVASNVSFYAEDLSNVKIKGANLNDGVFCKADLSHVDLSSTNLNNTKFDGAILNKAVFENANLDYYMRVFTKIHDNTIKSVSLSPDEKYILSGGEDKLAILWDFETGKMTEKFELNAKIHSVAFSKDNTKLAFGGSDMKISIVDIKTCKIIKELLPKNVSGHVNSIIFSPDSKSIAASYSDSLIRIYELNKKKASPKIFEGCHKSEILSITFAPDGNHLISASKDAIINIYNFPHSRTIKTLSDHNDEVISVIFSPEGRLFASCSKEGTSIIWSFINLNILHKFEEENGYINCLAFSPDGKRLALGNQDSSIKIRDTQSGKIMQEIGGYNSVFSLVFTSNGEKIISAGKDSIIRIWNVGFSKSIKKFEGHEGSVNTVAISKDGKIFASGGSDKKIIIWDALNYTLLNVLNGHSEDVTSISFSPNKSQLVSASYDRSIKIWDILSGLEIETLGELQNGYIKCLSYSPDGQHVVSGNGAYQIIIYDFNEKSSKTMGLHEEEVNALAFSKDGSMLASGSEDCMIKIWNFKRIKLNTIENQNFLFDLKGHEGSILCLAFSSNGRILASGSYDKCIMLWNLDEQIRIKKINEGISFFIKTLCFSSDEKFLVGGGGDKTIFYWNIDTNKLYNKFDGHESYVNSIAISSDGRQIISAAADNTVRIWDIENLKSNFINDNSNIIYSNKILKKGFTRFSCKNCVGIEDCERMDQKIKNIFYENLNMK